MSQVQEGASWDVGRRGGECGGEVVFVGGADGVGGFFGDDVFILCKGRRSQKG